ncbi:MAG: hypothetical protein K8L99_28015 [Anaerolineae bacterium]|nr:hypothetical protein [Anaerolineae bacterium]
MFKSFQALKRGVPNLVVAQRVLDKMLNAAHHSMADETGEAMVGLMVQGERTNGVPTLYVLDTIAPDESAVRQLHTFQQGDERQDEIIWWLQENWRIDRERHRSSGKPLQAKWDVPLRYLGDWHKQPGFMIQPSMGDQMTALDWLDDTENGMAFLLAPIVTLGHPSTTIGVSPNANFISLPFDEVSHMRVDFWYIHRDVRLFQPITPAVYPNEQLPSLSEYPWHLVKPDRASAEFRRLHDDELFTSVVLWDADRKPPLEICFMTARMGSSKVLILTTDWNYPQQPPSARVAPFRQMNADDDMFEVFEELWAQSEAVPDPPDWQWSAEKYLVDYIHALEKTPALHIESPAETAVAASDEVAAGVGGGQTDDQEPAEIETEEQS